MQLVTFIVKDFCYMGIQVLGSLNINARPVPDLHVTIFLLKSFLIDMLHTSSSQEFLRERNVLLRLPSGRVSCEVATNLF